MNDRSSPERPTLLLHRRCPVVFEQNVPSRALVVAQADLLRRAAQELVAAVVAAGGRELVEVPALLRALGPDLGEFRVARAVRGALAGQPSARAAAAVADAFLERELVAPEFGLGVRRFDRRALLRGAAHGADRALGAVVPVRSVVAVDLMKQKIEAVVSIARSPVRTTQALSN